jgi:glycosyltransferase involved in cell wall biosynthesis
VIRVGFMIDISDPSWTGGANYLSNLLRAIAGSQIVQPVIITGRNTQPSVLAQFPDIEVIHTDIVNQAAKGLLARLGEKLFGRYYVTERFLRANNIGVLSHSGHLGRRSSFPTIGWIPDFQHVRNPEFFSAHEIRRRDRWFTQLASMCHRVIVSSEDARRDLVKFRPSSERKARVLRFVSGLAAVPGDPGGQDILQRYGIEGPYFHLPNQFWIHKNHAVVIEALGVVRARGRSIRVVSTGNTTDSRRPGHLQELLGRAVTLGCAEDFKVLGLLPYADLVGLMRSSMALINPSFFEGWSTTVEEAKSLGKTIILSDIPVHREQAPDYAYFFDPKSPMQLADCMIEAADAYSLDRDMSRLKIAQENLPAKIQAFTARFEDIILDAVAGKNGNA